MAAQGEGVVAARVRDEAARLPQEPGRDRVFAT